MTNTLSGTTQKDFTAASKDTAPERVPMSDALFSAIKHGDLVRVQEILAETPGALESRDAAGNTPLLLAAQENRNEIAQWALMKKADPDAQNDIGMTALMFAATNGNVPLATALLDAEADDLLENALDENADDIARRRGNYTLAALIVQRQQQHLQELEQAARREEREELMSEREAESMTDKIIKNSAEISKRSEVFAEVPLTSRFINKVADVLHISKFLHIDTGETSKPAEKKEQAVSAPRAAVNNFLRHFRPS